MRKTDLAGVLSDFEDQLKQQSDFYDETWGVFPDAAHRKIASENYALAIGVMFEGFVNDLIIAYANRECSKVMEHLRNSLEECLRNNAKAKATFEQFGEIRDPKHLTVEKLRAILDSEGRNTSFHNYDAIEKRATQWLAAPHKQRFTMLDHQDRAIVNVLIAVRNNLAHRSKKSLDRLNEVLLAGPLHNTGLQRNRNRVRQAGHYLKANSSAGETRADLIGRQLGNIARQLAGGTNGV